MADLRRILLLECDCQQRCFCTTVKENRHYCYGKHDSMMAVKGVKTVA